MKNIISTAIFSAFLCVFLSASFLNAQSAKPTPSESSLTEYAVRKLAQPTTEDEENLLNTMAMDGWKLQTVTTLPPWHVIGSPRTSVSAKVTNRYYFSRNT